MPEDTSVEIDITPPDWLGAKAEWIAALIASLIADLRIGKVVATRSQLVIGVNGAEMNAKVTLQDIVAFRDHVRSLSLKVWTQAQAA